MSRRYYLVPAALLLSVAWFLFRGGPSSKRDPFSDFDLHPRPDGARPPSTDAGPSPAPNAPVPFVLPTPTLAPPPTAAALPATEMPGVRARDVIRGLEASGFTCSQAFFRRETIAWNCTSESAYGSCAVTLDAARTDTIRGLSATVTGSFTDFTAATILASVAGLAYRDAEPARARDWVATHIAEGGTIVIGSVRFELSGGTGARSLRMIAKGRD